MERINGKLTEVNNNFSIIALKRLFYLRNREKDSFEIKKLDNGAIDYQILKPLGDKITRNCPFSVPYSFAENPRIKEERERKRLPPERKYKELYASAVAGDIHNSTLRRTLSLWVKKQGNICIKNQNGYKFFESNAKGTSRYNKRNYWKIHDFCKEEDLLGKKAYFCTFTCTYAAKADNIVKKWQDFSEQLNNTLKIISAKYNIEYVCVKEAFLSGFPHAHCIFYVKDFIKSDRQKYLRTKRYSVVSAGALKETLNKFFTIGYTELARNTKKGTSNYLSKYISKNETTGLKKLMNKKNWTNTDRKQILTTFMPILANVRQFQKSETITALNGIEYKVGESISKNGANPVSGVDVIEKSLHLSNEEFIKCGRDSDYLITLCNNLPKCIQNEVRTISNRTLWKFTSEQITAVNNESNDYKAVIFKKSCPLTCSKCVYSKFLAQLLTESAEPPQSTGKSLVDLCLENGDNTEVMAKVSDLTKVKNHTKRFVKNYNLFMELIKERKRRARQKYELDVYFTVEYDVEEIDNLEQEILKELEDGAQLLLF